MNTLQEYPVWDAPTRGFHWINALSVFGLVALGLVILNASALGVSNAGKVDLKTVHVWIGYVFALNLGARLIWAFAGNRYARWRQILPGGRGYGVALRSYVSSFVAGRPQVHLGHNPLGRIGVALLLLLMVVQAITGLILAGTDLFYPPIGHWIAQWVAAPNIDPATLVPYAAELYDKVEYERMRALRKPVITTHLYCFYLLLATIVVHIAAVVVTELREGGGLISAMVTGRKIMRGQPHDDARP